MSTKSTLEFQVWLDKAADDIKWTESSLKTGIYYGACFTAQQSVEKSLKAFLIYKQGRFDKVHDLVKIIDECIGYDKNFISFRTKVAKLSFYYVQTRYPDMSEIDKFTQKEAEEALDIAKKLLDFISQKITP